MSEENKKEKMNKETKLNLLIALGAGLGGLALQAAGEIYRSKAYTKALAVAVKGGMKML